MRRAADVAVLADGVGADRRRRLHVFGYIPNDFMQGLVEAVRVRRHHLDHGVLTSACNTTGGTEGVGQATTRTVVTSSILILVVDYFLTQILLSVLTYA